MEGMHIGGKYIYLHEEVNIEERTAENQESADNPHWAGGGGSLNGLSIFSALTRDKPNWKPTGDSGINVSQLHKIQQMNILFIRMLFYSSRSIKRLEQLMQRTTNCKCVVWLGSYIEHYLPLACTSPQFIIKNCPINTNTLLSV